MRRTGSLFLLCLLALEALAQPAGDVRSFDLVVYGGTAVQDIDTAALTDRLCALGAVIAWKSAAE